MSRQAIQAKELTKTYKVRRKRAGMRDFFHAPYDEVHAVNNIDLKIAPGEFVGFIGPNGAGKSTTIKMLTGILARSDGDVRVFGLDPQTHRRQLAFRIGTVFGQRSQLWYHLPPRDTFEVLSRIYELDRRRYQKRLAQLVAAFELQDFLHIPIRKLSLGQRMRCEIAASLLHEPQLIFLDEPTIGLDVIAKQKIREVLSELNRQDGVTILLTSHDAGDIEELCARTIVINHGQMIFDDTTTTFKQSFITKKTVELVTTSPVSHPKPPVGTILTHESTKLVIEVSVHQKADIQELLSWATRDLSLADVTITEPPMEEIIARIYNTQAHPHAK